MWPFSRRKKSRPHPNATDSQQPSTPQAAEPTDQTTTEERRDAAGRTLAEAIDALNGVGLMVRDDPAARTVLAEIAERTEPWFTTDDDYSFVNEIAGGEDEKWHPLTSHIDTIADSPLDDFDSDWPAQIDGLARAFNVHDEVTDTRAEVPRDDQGVVTGEGTLFFTFRGQPHTETAEFLGKYIDHEAYLAIADLFAGADRVMVSIDEDTHYAWPLADREEEFRTLFEL